MKRLFRSEKDRKIAGVVGGLAEYFNIDAAAANHHSLIVYFFDGNSRAADLYRLGVCSSE